jgi:hypothetical protein
LPPTNSRRWSASRRLVVANIDGIDPRVVADGGVIGPRWSADGRQLFFAREGYLWLVDATGGSPIAITAVDENIPSWYATNSFEQQPYIMPGDDVWTAADWSRRP